MPIDATLLSPEYCTVPRLEGPCSQSGDSPDVECIIPALQPLPSLTVAVFPFWETNLTVWISMAIATLWTLIR